MKKLISLALALMLALSCVSFTAFAERDYAYVGETYTLTIENLTLVADSVETWNLQVGQANNIHPMNSTYLEVVGTPVQSGTDIVVTVRALSASESYECHETGLEYTGYRNGDSGPSGVLSLSGKPIRLRPTVSVTAATTAPEFVEGKAKTASIGTVATANFINAVTYTTAKVYTTADGTTEATGITATVDGTALKVTTTAAVKNGTYYVDIFAGNDYEEEQTLSSRVPVKVYGTFLDLEADATYPDSDTVEQLYTASVTTNKTDVTKVQVSWKLQNIAASVTVNKIWNAETLSWDSDTGKTDTATASDVTAVFDFVNLSSLLVDASVKFETKTGITNTSTFVDDDTEEWTETDDKKVFLGTSACAAATDNTGKITVTVTPDTDYFKKITESVSTPAKYGTYTVSIERAYIPQAAPMFSESFEEIDDSTRRYTFTVNSSGHGKVMFAYAENADCDYDSDNNKYSPPAGVTWSEATTYDVDRSKTYIFFAKYTGDKYYAESSLAHSSCFVAGTTITMANGTFKNIEDIVAGDQVLSYDTVKNETYVSTVRHTVKGNTAKVATVTLANGTTVRCTPSHPIYTTDGWKSVNPSHKDVVKEFASEKLNVGDTVVTDSGSFAVISITVADEEAEVYTFSVTSNGNVNNRNYFANGVVAHNTSAE